jgi:hypothetical protein
MVSFDDDDDLSDYKEVTSSDEEYRLKPKTPPKPANPTPSKVPSKPSRPSLSNKPPRSYRILCTPLYRPTSSPTIAQTCASFLDAHESLATGIEQWKERAAVEKRVVLVAKDEMSFGVFEEWGERMCVQRYWIEEVGKGEEESVGKREKESVGGKKTVRWGKNEEREFEKEEGEEGEKEDVNMEERWAGGLRKGET